MDQVGFGGLLQGKNGLRLPTQADSLGKLVANKIARNFADLHTCPTNWVTMRCAGVQDGQREASG